VGALVGLSCSVLLAGGAGAAGGSPTTWNATGEVTVDQVEHFDNGSSSAATHVTWTDTQHFAAHFSFSYELLPNGEVSGEGGSGHGSGAYDAASWSVSGVNGGQGAFSCSPKLTGDPFTIVASGQTTNGKLGLDVQFLGGGVSAPQIHMACGADWDVEWPEFGEVPSAWETLAGVDLKVDPSHPVVPTLTQTTTPGGADITGTHTIRATVQFVQASGAGGGAGGGGAGGGGPGGGNTPPPSSPPPAPPGSLSPPLPAPVGGSTVDVKTFSGTVLVNGLPLSAGEQIHVGATIDTTHGTMTITSASPTGGLETANLAGGKFKVLQHGAKAGTELALEGGSFGVCKRRTQAATLAPVVVRGLWGNGKGDFVTEGRFGAATVRGTIWLTEDRCDGTLVAVRSGVVSVLDRVRHRTVLVTAGHSYLA
jgi:hypothetical protein